MLKKLKNEIVLLDNRIHALAVQMGNEAHYNDEYIDLKRERHLKHIELIDEIRKPEHKSEALNASQLREKYRNKPIPPKRETGIWELDNALRGGIEEGIFCMVAGQSGAGKTTLAMQILANVSEGVTTKLYSFEMGEHRTLNYLTKLLKTENQWNNLYIDFETNELDNIVRDIEVTVSTYNTKFFVVDSRMKLNSNGENEVIKNSNITKELSKVAHKYGIILILINQMSEESIKNKRLAFKGSGDAQYDSDLSLFILKDDEGNRKLICNKNRQLDGVEFSFDYNKNVGGVVEVEFEDVLPEISDRVEMSVI